MRKSLFAQIAPYLLLFYAVGLAAAFLYGLATFSVSVYLPGLRMEYCLKRALLLFIDYCIPLHAAAIAVAASLAAREPAARKQAQPFSAVVSSTIVAFLLLTAGYTALYEGLSPQLRTRLSDMRYQSQLARTYKKQAAQDVAAGDYRSALDAVDRYLAIDPENKEMKDERTTLFSRAARETAAATSAGEETTPAAETAEAAMEKARAAFDRKDWYAANYYAQSAASLDPRRGDAQRLASEAWNMIASSAESPDAATSELFLKKKQAYSLLVGGDPLAAYYSFLALAAKNPKDQDVAAYLKEAGEKLKAITFFLDDARKLETLPGTQGILFLNRNDASGTEAVAIGKMVQTTVGDAYFYNIEAIRYSATGAVLWHFTAPYGMRGSDNSLLMHCIDRTDPSKQLLPQYLKGSRPEADRNVLVLTPTVEELVALSTSRDSLSMMGILELWRLRNDLGSFGMARQSITVDMAMKTVMPFAFLIISLLSLAMGWAFRTHRPGRLPFGNVLLMPLAPVVMALFSLLYVYAHRVVTGFMVLAFGLTAAAIVLGALQLVLLVAALVLLAGQSPR